MQTISGLAMINIKKFINSIFVSKNSLPVEITSVESFRERFRYSPKTDHRIFRFSFRLASNPYAPSTFLMIKLNSPEIYRYFVFA
jgi:hypothetical protein